jgi:hypothetical protein
VAADFTAETFRPHVGELFMFGLEDGREVELELVEIEEGAPGER